MEFPSQWNSRARTLWCRYPQQDSPSEVKVCACVCMCPHGQCRREHLRCECLFAFMRIWNGLKKTAVINPVANSPRSYGVFLLCTNRIVGCVLCACEFHLFCWEIQIWISVYSFPSWYSCVSLSRPPSERWLLVKLQYAAGWDRRIIRSLPHFLPSPWMVLSSSFTHVFFISC